MKQATTAFFRPSRAIVTAALTLGMLAPAFAAGVKIENPWIRWLPANLPAGGYAKVVNDTDATVELVGASSPSYGEVMLHQTVEQGGVMKMLHVKSITIAAHKSMAFAPGGYHIMLMQPKPGIEPGQKLPVTLEFKGGEKVTAEFEVRKPTAGAPKDMQMQGDMKGMQH